MKTSELHPSHIAHFTFQKGVAIVDQPQLPKPAPIEIMPSMENVGLPTGTGVHVCCAYCGRSLTIGPIMSIAIPVELGLPPFLVVCPRHVAPRWLGARLFADSLRDAQRVVVSNVTGRSPAKLLPTPAAMTPPADAGGSRPADPRSTWLDRFIKWALDWRIVNDVA